MPAHQRRMARLASPAFGQAAARAIDCGACWSASPCARLAAYACCVLFGWAVSANVPGAERPLADPLPTTPNVVVILADDLGWGDVASLNRDSAMTTPRIDSIATGGVRFSDAHSPSSMCSPTRYGLLTGRYAWRTWLKTQVLDSYSPPLILRGISTLGTLFKAHGYRTAAIGKWHLGLGFQLLPEGTFDPLPGNPGIDLQAPIADGPVELGFDEFFGLSANLGWPPFAYIRNDRFTAPLDLTQMPIDRHDIREGPRALDFEMPKVLDRFKTEAVTFIKQSAESETPFFLYFPLTAPHQPLLPARRFRDTTVLGPFGDYVAQVDWVVGEVLDALDDADVRDSTLLVFTSDNGSLLGTLPDHAVSDHTEDSSILDYRAGTHQSNGGWRGNKGSVYEGGHRVPLLAQWPAVVEAGSEIDATVVLTDLYATLAEILGEPRSPGVAPDSTSLLPMLRGEPVTRRVPAVHHSGRGMFALRDGPWKLVFGDDPPDKKRGKPFRKPWQLYDLSRDPTEANNLIDERPEVVGRLSASFEAIRLFTEQERPPVRGATLSSLTVRGAELGSFDEAQTTYATSVPNEVTTATVSVTPTLALSNVVIADPAGATAGRTRTVTLTEGANPVTIQVGAARGNATRTYTVWVHRELPAVGATLSALSLDGIDLGVFDPNRTSYTATVPVATTTTTLTVVPSDASSTTMMTDESESVVGTKKTVDLVQGENLIEVAVASADGVASAVYTAIVTRGLTARFAKLPEAHSGELFQAQILFSDPIVTSYKAVRDDRFTVTNGTIRKARRIDRRNDLWEIEVQPSSNKDVLLLLPATTDCAASRAVCTSGGDPLSKPLEGAVAGPVAQTPPEFRVTASPSAISEGGTATVTVALPPGSTYADDQVIFLQADGTATPADFSLAPEVVILQARTRLVTASLTAVADELREDLERVTVLVMREATPVGAVTVTILADPVAP